MAGNLNVEFKGLDSAVSGIQNIINLLSGLDATTTKNIRSVNNLSNAMIRLGKTDFSSFTNSSKEAAKSLEEMSTKMSTMNFDGIKSATYNISTFEKAMTKATNINVEAFKNKMVEVIPTLNKFSENMRVATSGGIGDLSGIKDLVSILTRLPNAIEKMGNIDPSSVSQVFTTLNREVIPFITTLKDASKEVTAFASILTSLQRVSVANSFNKLREGAKRYEEQQERVNVKTRTFKGILLGLNIGKIYALANSLKFVARQASSMIMYAASYTENLNLAQNVFRDYYADALQFQGALHNSLMTNENEMIKYQATYMSMLQAVSGNDEVSYGVSEQLTKMSLDIASLFNQTEEQAASDLKSALAGMTKPIRKYGLDITEQSLTGTAMDIGLDRTVRQLNQAEKELLRYITMVNQLEKNNTFGDMARTINSLANQWKILQNNVKEMGMWLGAIFIPLLTKVVIILNGIISAISIIFKTIASMMGYDPLSGIGSATGTLGDEIDDYNDGLDDANEKAKKLKNNLLGIDELNIGGQEANSSDTTSTNVGGIDPAILKALEEAEAKMKGFEETMANIQNKAVEIRDRLLDWLGVELLIDENGDVIGAKIRDGYTNLEKIRDVLVIMGGLAIWGLLDKLFKTKGIQALWGIIKKASTGVVTFGKAAIGAFNGSEAAASALTFMISRILGTLAIVGGAVITLSAIFSMFEDKTSHGIDHLSTLVVGLGVIILGLGAVFASPFLVGIGAIIAAAGLLWDELTLGMSYVIAYWGNALAKLLEYTSYVVQKNAEAFVGMTARISYIFQSWDIKSVILRIVSSILDTVENWLNKFMDNPIVKGAIEFLTGKSISKFDFSYNIDKSTGSKSYDQIYQEQLAASGLYKASQAIQDAATKIEVWNAGLVEFNKSEYDRKKEEDGMFSSLTRMEDSLTNMFDKFDLSGTYMFGDNAKEEESDNSAEMQKKLEELNNLQEQANKENAKAQEEQALKQDEIKKAQEDTANATDGVKKATEEQSYNQTQSWTKNRSQLSNIWAKLDLVQRACENIRINVTNNYISYSSDSKSSKHAAGGFPAVRGTFVYNEGNNAELLGSINGRTAVVNNEQIISAVSSGVANAVGTVLAQNNNNNNGGGNLTCTVKGKDLLFAIEQTQKSRGRQTVSNNLSRI